MVRLALIVILIVGAFVGLKTFKGTGDSGSIAENSAAVEGELITLISKGQAVDIADHVPAKGVVLVEFTADW